MSLQRRSFLSGILAAAAAPAIARAASLMPIYVPKQDLILPEGMYLPPGDFTIEGWISDFRSTPHRALYPVEKKWQNVAIAFSKDTKRAFIDGIEVSPNHPSVSMFMQASSSALGSGGLYGTPTLLDELKISSVDKSNLLLQGVTQ